MIEITLCASENVKKQITVQYVTKIVLRRQYPTLLAQKNETLDRSPDFQWNLLVMSLVPPPPPPPTLGSSTPINSQKVTTDHRAFGLFRHKNRGERRLWTTVLASPLLYFSLSLYIICPLLSSSYRVSSVLHAYCSIPSRDIVVMFYTQSILFYVPTPAVFCSPIPSCYPFSLMMYEK